MSEIILATITQVETSAQRAQAVIDGATTATNIWPGKNSIIAGDRVVLTRAGGELFVIANRGLVPDYYEDFNLSNFAPVSGWNAMPSGGTTLKGNMPTAWDAVAGKFTAPVAGVYSIGFSVYTGSVTAAAGDRITAAITSGSLGTGSVYSQSGVSGSIGVLEATVSLEKYFAAGAVAYFSTYVTGNFVGVTLLGAQGWLRLVKRA
jgi:hypothetical protein